MAAPTAFSWDTSNTNILQPDAGHQLAGWAVNEKPTSSNHNWMFQNLYNWVNYLNPIAQIFTANFSSSTTWTVNHNLNRAHVTIVTDTNGGIGNGITPDNISYGLNTDTITFGVAQAGAVVCR